MPDSKLKILIVDDDNEMNLLLRDFLTRLGYEVTSASSASNALKLIHGCPKRFNPDLVVSDVIMGPMSGIALTKQLKMEKPQMPVVLFSSFGNREIEKEALACGANAYLHKPFQLSEMADIIKKQIKRK